MGVSKKAKVMVLNSSGSCKLAEGVSGVLTTNREICADAWSGSFGMAVLIFGPQEVQHGN
jgi:hypothetical protein